MKNRATKCFVLLSLLVFSLSCGNLIEPQDATSIEFLSAPGAEMLALPFSEAVRVGDMPYLSGQIGIVPGTSGLVPGGIGEETRQAMENIKAILERNGSTLETYDPEAKEQEISNQEEPEEQLPPLETHPE